MNFEDLRKEVARQTGPFVVLREAANSMQVVASGIAAYSAQVIRGIETLDEQLVPTQAKHLREAISGFDAALVRLQAALRIVAQQDVLATVGRPEEKKP